MIDSVLKLKLAFRLESISDILFYPGNSMPFITAAVAFSPPLIFNIEAFFGSSYLRKRTMQTKFLTSAIHNYFHQTKTISHVLCTQGGKTFNKLRKEM